jgi:hypothetical protein
MNARSPRVSVYVNGWVSAAPRLLKSPWSGAIIARLVVRHGGRVVNAPSDALLAEQQEYFSDSGRARGGRDAQPVTRCASPQWQNPVERGHE